MEYSIGFVILFGLGIVFFGLICIVLLIILMGKIMQIFEGKPKDKGTKAPETLPEEAEQPKKVRPVILAAIMSVISQDSGIPVSKLNVVSIKRVER